MALKIEKQTADLLTKLQDSNKYDGVIMQDLQNILEFVVIANDDEQDELWLNKGLTN